MEDDTKEKVEETPKETSTDSAEEPIPEEASEDQEV